MNKVLKKAIVVALIMSVSHNATAAFILNGTRYIFDEEKKNISFEVTNNADRTYGGQIWIDNESQNKNDVFIIPAPPFFKVKPKQKQIIRLIKVNPNIPNDRESLFWLNVQEVPPKPDKNDGSVLAIAMNTQVKLIYRPSMLKDERKDAEKYIQLINRNKHFILKNPTPYYFAVVSVKQGKKVVNLNPKQISALAQFAPFSEVSLDKVTLNGKASIDAINDWGGIQNYALN